MPSDKLQQLPDSDSGTEAGAEQLHLEVQVDSPSACQRHITVTVAREDIDRYFDDALAK